MPHDFCHPLPLGAAVHVLFTGQVFFPAANKCNRLFLFSPPFLSFVSASLIVTENVAGFGVRVEIQQDVIYLKVVVVSCSSLVCDFFFFISGPSKAFLAHNV